MKKEKIIISCGGTGGHIFPALEIAKSLRLKNPEIDILFVGALNKMEMIKIPREGFPIVGLWIQGLYRKSIFKNILFPIKLIISLIQSLFLILYHRPIAIVGTGGFASGPVLYIAALLHIKTYIQEQNCYAGLTNRLLSKHVNKVFVAHDGMHKFFPEKKILNLGNPVRNSLKIDKISKKESQAFFGLKEDVFTILIVGGSLGAEPINRQIFHLIHSQNPFIINKQQIQFIWQTGLETYDSYKRYIDLNKIYNCSVHRFINRMDLAYHASDIVISRAGAIAIAEICFLSKPSILIPSPYVTANHQTINAEYLKNHNAALMLSEKEMNSSFKKETLNFKNILIQSLSSLGRNTHQVSPLIKRINFLKNINNRKKIGDNANRLFQYNSASKIVDIILKDYNVK